MSTAVVAQSDDGRPAGWLTFTEQDRIVGEHDPATTEEGVEQLHGMPITCDVTFSDPRLSGVQSNISDQDCFDTGICLYWGTMEIVGADGTWRGWFTGPGAEDPQGKTDLYIAQTGAGAYEGLTSTRLASGQFWQPLTHIGVIYQGDPPPMPKSSTE